MTLFLSYLINGISLGSVYAIIALGYTMVYGIAKMLNFAHGDVIMVGAYVSFCAMQYLGLPKLVSVVLAMAVCTALGIVIEGLAYKPLRKAPSLAVLITAIGVSYFLQNSALLIWGSAPKSYPSVISLGSLTLMGGQLVISGGTIVTVLANIVIMVALTAFTGRTKFGKAMRAVSEDKGAAELMGINVNMTISMTFAIGSALAAIAGVLLCSAYPTLQPTTGSMPGIKAFTAAVFGGIGSIPGAMIGGVLLAHTATFEAVQAVEGMFNPDYQPRQVGFFPSCTYCYPQVASVGKTERALKEAGVEYKVGKFPFQAIGKAVAAGETDGFVKTLYGAKHGELLGAHIVGPEATELIATLGVGIQAELTDEDIHATIFAHPTLSEAIHESMLASEGIAIHM